MSKYQFFFTQTVSATVQVEADDLSDAKELAYEELPPEVCAQCSGWGQSWTREDDGEWVLNENQYEVDGEFVDETKVPK